MEAPLLILQLTILLAACRCSQQSFADIGFRGRSTTEPVSDQSLASPRRSAELSSPFCSPHSRPSFILRLGWTIGVVVGSMAMLGDLFSSFVKRRLNLPPSSRATFLDQVPESLFPLLASRSLRE
jgi:hypothetical protein